MSPTALDEPATARPKGLRARLSALPRRTLLINIALAVLVIAVLVLGILQLGPRRSSDADVRTVAVTRGNVTAKVTATGNAASSVSTPVSFPTPGVLTAVNVAAGDTVTRGELLATIDDAAARLTLRTAQAQLANSRAALAQSAAGPTDVKAQQDQLSINQAQQGVANANATLGTAQHTRELDDDSTASAVDNAKTQLANDKTAQDNAVNSAQISKDSACTVATTTPAPTNSSASMQTTANTPTSNCDSATQSLETAQDNRDAVIDKDNQAITTAEQNRTATLAKDDATIQTNRQQVTTAQGQVDTAQLTQQAALHPQTPAQIAQVQASVQSAQVQVDSAQRTLDQTRLVAPQDGVVLAVSGKVGETSSSGGATSAATGAASAAAASTTSAGSGFIVIANLSKLSVTADIAEADAAKIKLGQVATVTFPGTGSTATGSVTQITPQSTVTNNVVLYPITVSLDTAPAGVVVGATADLSVTTGTADNVLQVPTAAITTIGSRHTVTIRRDSTQTVVPVQTGVSGDTTTEITGGLSGGEQLVLPSGVATVTGGFPGAGRQNGGGG